ncbi:MAG: tetratricopeptide repeat protein, partial [Deltaproteobacteria bacterium]|nr:tetratricopeptide repeat protein [Nannocystaceae bacterium]
AELAEAHGADALLPSIWHTLARLTAFDLAAVAEARRFAAHGDAALVRLDHPPQLEVDAAITRAVIAESAGDLATNERELEVALALLRNHADPRDHRLLVVLEQLAHVAAGRGDWARADDLYATVLERRSERLGPDHPDVLLAAFNIGLNHRARGQWELARSTFERVLAGQLERFGASIRCAPSLVALAEAELNTGAIEAARDHAERAWALQREHLPAGHHERGSALALLSAIHAARNDDLSQLRIDLQLLGELDDIGSELDRVVLSNDIGWLLCELDDCGRAVPYYERVAASADTMPMRIAAVHGRARIALARGDRDEARRGLELALAQALAHRGDDIAYERAEIELHLAELLDVIEPGAPRIAELARSAAASYRRLAVRPTALARALALVD